MNTEQNQDEWIDPAWESMTPEQQRIETILFGLEFQDAGDRYLHIEEIQRYIRTSIPKPVVEILEELRKAATKFPSWPTDPFHALAIVGEEFGELQQSFLKANYEGADEADRKEAIQLAAMAIRFLMHWDDYWVPEKFQAKTALGMKGGGDE